MQSASATAPALGKNRPVVQFTHALLPGAALYCHAEHNMQSSKALAPRVLEYLPAGQLMQSLPPAPPGKYLPTAHEPHSSAPLGEAWPEAHAEQLAAEDAPK